MVNWTSFIGPLRLNAEDHVTNRFSGTFVDDEEESSCRLANPCNQQVFPIVFGNEEKVRQRCCWKPWNADWQGGRGLGPQKIFRQLELSFPNWVHILQNCKYTIHHERRLYQRLDWTFHSKQSNSSSYDIFFQDCPRAGVKENENFLTWTLTD